MEFEIWILNGLILFGEIIAVMIAFIHFRKVEQRDEKLIQYKEGFKEYLDNELKKIKEGVIIIDNKKE